MQNEVRELPSNIEAEQALLGAILMNNDAFSRVADIVNEGHFYDNLHAKIFGILKATIEAGKRASPVTIKPFLDNDPDIGNLKPSEYLARLCSEATTVINAPDYARIIADMAIRRGIIKSCAYTQDLAYNASIHSTPQDIAKALLNDIETHLENGGHVSKTETLENITDRYLNDLKSPPQGIKTGIEQLDLITGGFNKGELTIIGGRPSMGKSTIAVDFTRRFLNQGLNVVFFSLEMPAREMMNRFASNMTHGGSRELHYSTINQGNLQHHDERIVEGKINVLKSQKLHLVCTGSTTVAHIRLELNEATRRLKSRPDILFIDQLTHVKSHGKHNGNKVNELAEITADLKRLAMNENIIIILFSQLNRGLESRENKQPTLSDFRDSGSLEQDADKAIFLYRKSYYLMRSHDEGERAIGLSQSNEVEFIIAKNRGGGIGNVNAYFNAPTSYVGNFTEIN